MYATLIIVLPSFFFHHFADLSIVETADTPPSNPLFIGLYHTADVLEVRRTKYLQSRLKISVSMDISILAFYGYIGYIGDISVDIFL